MATYDKYYKKENYFGSPCPELIAFFEAFPNRGTLCDMGAGQGRDSIPLHKLGYSVTAVDISKKGLEQLKDKCPGISTELSDLYTYDISEFDFILLDSIVHFYKNDLEKETRLIKNIISQMKTGGVLVNNMIKSDKAQKHLLKIYDSFGEKIKLIAQKHIAYPDFDATYHMTAVEKL
jgi:2-polyprenyl-3-methyl-5-hydroxy-6-metoxy-1,4-benzoquinol methylase